MIAIASTAMSVACLLAFLYPYMIYPRILARLPQRPYGPTQGAARGPAPRAALLFCAYNEERALPEKIENLRALKAAHPDLAIFGYSDASSDGTNALLEAAHDVLTPVIATERAGKATGMARMVAMTDCDVLVFTDANVILPPDDLARLLAYFDDPEIGTVAGTLCYTFAPGAEGSATATIGKAYWEREERLKRRESRSGSTIGADGSIFARRRAGYPAVPPHLLDDFVASFSVVFDGLRCVSAPDVRAYERVISDSSDEFRRKRRIGCRAFNTYRYLRPRLATLSVLDRFKFVSHKLLRWLGAYFLAGFALFGAVAAVAWFGLATTLLLGLAAAAATVAAVAAGLRPALKAVEILKAVAGTGLGVIESLRGETYQTWRPAQSR